MNAATFQGKDNNAIEPSCTAMELSNKHWKLVFGDQVKRRRQSSTVSVETHDRRLDRSTRLPIPVAQIPHPVMILYCALILALNDRPDIIR